MFVFIIHKAVTGMFIRELLTGSLNLNNQPYKVLEGDANTVCHVR